MSEGEGKGPKGESLSAQVEMAKRRLEEAVAAASAAEKRTAAEIRALEADLENERLSKEEAIAAAQSRLAEIEAHAEAAERRIEEAEKRAAETNEAVADAEARAREAAAAWLRDQVDAIRREAGQR
jgi:chromosome segregation ATPase